MWEFTAEEGYTTRDLLAYGRDHVTSGGLCRTSFDCYDSAGYLSHLRIELLLKGVPPAPHGRFPNEHDLVRLLSLVQEHEPSITLDGDTVMVKGNRVLMRRRRDAPGR
jgi:hypothetical protein